MAHRPKPTALLPLPLKIKATPGGFVIHGADGGRGRIWVYGEAEPGRRSATGLLSREEAEALAKEIARALTDRWASGRN